MKRNISFTDEAKADLAVLAGRDRRLVVEAIRVLKAVGAGRITPTRLRTFSKTGDLSDCFKIYFGLEQEDDTHRVVLREVHGQVEVLEVVALEDRQADLPYLLAATRLARLDDPVRRSDAQRAIFRVRDELDN